MERAGSLSQALLVYTAEAKCLFLFGLKAAAAVAVAAVAAAAALLVVAGGGGLPPDW